jgi:hypothetical protein
MYCNEKSSGLFSTGLRAADCCRWVGCVWEGHVLACTAHWCVAAQVHRLGALKGDGNEHCALMPCLPATLGPVLAVTL